MKNKTTNNEEEHDVKPHELRGGICSICGTTMRAGAATLCPLTGIGYIGFYYSRYAWITGDRN